jgi:tetratricopeptide (TPR) repeat protein
MITASYDHLCRTARQAIAQGRVDEACHLFNEALGLRPSSPDAHYGLALASFMLNDLENAAYHFKESARLDPLRASAYINLGAVLNRLEEPEEAARVLCQAIKIDPNRAEGYYNLALVYRKMGDLSRAIEAYREALRLDPQQADAHNNLGNIFKEQKRYVEAIDEYRKALELQPGWEKAEHGLAEAEQAAKDAVAAEEPTSPEASTIADPDRRIDAMRHMANLEVMHDSAKAAQNCGGDYIQALQGELEVTVRELATTLIGRRPGTLVYLAPLMEKFEKALDHVKRAHEELQANLRRAQRAGTKMLS